MKNFLTGFFFVVGLSLSSLLATQQDWEAEQLSVKDQVKRFQLAYEGILFADDSVSDEDSYTTSSKYPDLSSRLWDLCNMALCQVQKALRDTEASEDDFKEMEALKNHVTGLKDKKNLHLNDLKSLYIDLAFLRDRQKPQSYRVSEAFLGDYLGRWHSKTAEEIKEDTHNLDEVATIVYAQQLYILPEKGDSIPQTYLKAFLQDPQKKINILPLEGDDRSPHAKDSFFIRARFGSTLNYFRESLDDLETFRKLCERIWDPEDPLSTACLYFMVNDFMIDIDMLTYDPDLPLSKEEQFFTKWLEETCLRVEKKMAGEKPSCFYFADLIESLFGKTVWSDLRSIDNNSQTCSLTFCMRPNLPEFETSFLEATRVKLNLEVLAKKALLQEYRVAGWEKMCNFPDSLFSSSGEPLETKVDPREESFLLSVLEKNHNRRFWAPTDLNDFVNLQGDYCSVLNSLYPEADLSLEEPHKTLGFFYSLLEKFRVQSQQKLKSDS